MRGTLTTPTRSAGIRRIIPAYAGNAQLDLLLDSMGTDHPRVCGEREIEQEADVITFGSSPRMRGTRPQPAPGCGRTRIIPAYAGNAGEAGIELDSAADHPRVCGERAPAIDLDQFRCGSSPRMRGTRTQWRSSLPLARIIPAYAGNAPAARP